VLHCRALATHAGAAGTGVSGFACPIRIYWEDTDAGGIVYHANYFRFMERARTEWLRSLGIEQEPLRTEQGMIFVVVSAEATFHRPARYADLLQVSCRVQRATRASLILQQDIVRSSDALLLVSGTVRVACLDAEKFRPRPMPPSLFDLRAEPAPVRTLPTQESAGGSC
jgi:acyl-CoA thioester hydrolase